MTKWAGYLYPHGTHEEGERPVAYIVVLNDLRHHQQNNKPIVTANFPLCFVVVNRKNNNIPNQYHVESMVALGYPKETSIMEDRKADIKYYKDEKGVLHVPKRTFDEVVFYNKGVEQR